MSQASSLEREMLELINQERTSRGLDPLKLELNLNQSAEDHSEWMLAADVFSHTGSGGSSPTQRMDAAGFDFSGSWRSGENVAYQSERGASGLSDDVEDLHQALMNSSGHRANILNANFDYIGIGIEYGDYKGYDVVMVTQNFAATQGSVDLDTGGGGGSSSDPVFVVQDAPPPADPAEIVGTGGGDKLLGTGGDDVMLGYGGNDKLMAGAGDDELRGGSGNDKLDGGSGGDALFGGSGKDRALYKSADAGVRADLQNAGSNTGDAKGDTYVSIEQLMGSHHGDVLAGTGGDNRLYGSKGNDALFGRGGADVLKGGSGNDTLDGGSGADKLFGGSGSDMFVFGAGDGQDRVMDFADGDLLDLRGLDLSAGEFWDAADEIGGDVVIDLGSDRLIVENVSMSDLQNDIIL